MSCVLLYCEELSSDQPGSIDVCSATGSRGDVAESDMAACLAGSMLFVAACLAGSMLQLCHKQHTAAL